MFGSRLRISMARPNLQRLSSIQLAFVSPTLPRVTAFWFGLAGRVSNFLKSSRVKENGPHSSDFNHKLFCCPWLFLGQPPPPIIEQDQDEAFQICWESVCEKLDLFIGTCSVQYRTEVDRDWREVPLLYFYFYHNLQLLIKHC